MFRLPASLLAVSLGLALGCKVEASATTSPDGASTETAKPDEATSEPKPGPDAGEGAEEAVDDGAGEGDGGETPTSEEGGPGDTLSAKPASCGEHAAGDSWKEDCNTCRCSDQGEAMCTRMACGPQD